jgi:hypothetical protein
MQQVREGLRIRCIGVDSEVRAAILSFGKWLRGRIQFPIRVVVYVKKDVRIKNMDGELVCGTFFAPYEKEIEPDIRLATGDYYELKEELGRDDALATILHTFAHEIVHYDQWVKDQEFSERRANYRATRLIHEYGETRERQPV